MPLDFIFVLNVSRFLLSLIIFTSLTLVICDSTVIYDNKQEFTNQNGPESFLKWSIERCKAADDYKFKVKAFAKFSRWLVRNCKELEATSLYETKGKNADIVRATTRRPTQRPPTQRPPATTQRPPIGGTSARPPVATTQRPPIGTLATTRSTTRNPNQPIFPTSTTNYTEGTTAFPPGNFWPQPTTSSSFIQKNISTLTMIVLILLAKFFI